MWSGFPPAPLLPIGYANLNDPVIDEAVAVLAGLLSTGAEGKDRVPAGR
jgi:hypothetical protein